MSGVLVHLILNHFQKMRGGEGTSLGFLPSHSLAISVSEPQKVRKWLLAKVVYQIK